MTRNVLAERMGISLSLANKVAAELMATGLIHGASRSESGGGRPAGILSLTPSAGYAVGVNVDDTSQTAVVTDLNGAVIACLVEPAAVSTDRGTILSNLKDLIRRSIEDARVSERSVLGLGVCARAIVDPTSGLLMKPADASWEAAWTDSPLLDSLREAVSYPHILVDDVVRALGLAEANYGRGSRDRDFVYVLADTGIGMAFMQQGVPYIGFSHIAGEIGHVPVGRETTPCACGNRGCLCTAISAEAIMERLKRRLAESPVHSVLRNRSDVTMQVIVQVANEGDRLASTIMSEAGELCGEALAIIVNLLGPGLIVLGGISAESKDFVDTARRITRMKALEKASRNVEIEKTALDRCGAARGAATLVLDALFAPGSRSILDLAGNA